ncbi:hypothetical protein DPMN_157917 [Dreissena polymorpha]|uniref:Uncharacterized protein n=1 Tax=Dreissena polymorpha TaxID=45954 RepID=A0A9D4ELG2_DREPO|nr:hypothetical protein DPMN_157917 [Dreissena polymorpha]
MYAHLADDNVRVDNSKAKHGMPCRCDESRCYHGSPSEAGCTYKECGDNFELNHTTGGDYTLISLSN